jgi:hypothetical protein
MADGVRPERFGPFLQQGFGFRGNPAGWRDVPLTGSYSFQAGWMEPINAPSGFLFRSTYVEAQGNAEISPYQADIGTAFNLKPIRFLEAGVGYNRLLFHKSLVGFPAQGPPSQWRAMELIRADVREWAGADVFTFQGNATVNMGRLQLHAGAQRELWDVDASEHEFLVEYQTDFLIRKRDRINSVYGQLHLNLEPYLAFLGFTMRGFTLRQQFWWTSQTELQQHLVSGGISGLRWGRNSGRRYRGLDVFTGWWLEHPQVPGDAGTKSLYLNLQWVWNIQVLRLSAN